MTNFDRAVEQLLMLPRLMKRAIALVLDASLCLLTVWFAFYLRLGEWVTLSHEPWKAAVAAPLLALPIFSVFGLYRAVFRYVSWDAMAAITQAVFVYGCIYASIFAAYGVENVPRTVGFIQPILLLIAITASRILARYLLGGRYRQLLNRARRRNVLIYGAGSTGRQLASALADSGDMRLMGFIDNDPGLHGNAVGGVRVFSPHRLADLVEQFEISEVLLAIPSAGRQRRNEILQLIRATGVAVRTLPGILDVVRGKVTVNDLRPLEIDDLLGREVVPPDVNLLERNIRGKIVLVTGAGGSIGSELCRQIHGMGPTRLILVEASEFALYAIHGELTRHAIHAPGEPEIVPILGSVCDDVRMRKIFASCLPDTVFHAAAYKHVPLVEQNIVEGVRNNVIGTSTCASAAHEAGVASFVLVSTDKAVRPTNVMGASKRLAEMTLQALASESKDTNFSMVRFGNVLGSSGSVVPLFRQQIANGGPVTVTHHEVTRYFMTMPEAAQLVLQAGAMAKGGEVFVLDMGAPVKVIDLAVRMIELTGLRVRDELNPDGDIEVVITGLRPGEKLYEELLIGDDPTATSHPRVMMAREDFLPVTELEAGLGELRAALSKQDAAAVRALLSRLVPEYVPSDELVDCLLTVPASDSRPTPALAHPRGPETVGDEARI